MATAFRPGRLLVPVITPFDEAGRVDGDALERHAEDVLAAGAAGLVAVATTAEATALDADERALAISVCARVCAAREVALIVGVMSSMGVAPVQLRSHASRKRSGGDIAGVGLQKRRYADGSSRSLAVSFRRGYDVLRRCEQSLATSRLSLRTLRGRPGSLPDPETRMSARIIEHMRLANALCRFVELAA